ncbi:MAG: ATP-dependent DNA ligase [Marmoricola sp.]
MLLRRVVDVSGEVAATRSRNAKRDLVAALLLEGAAEEIELVTTYLSGTLPQRRTGLGWRSMTALPEPAAEPSVTLSDLDRTLSALAALAGVGSAAERSRRTQTLFARLTAPEQAWLRGVLTGTLRQGALDAVVLDAIAVAAAVPVHAVRRAATFSAPTGPVAVAALTGGEAALAAFGLVAGRPVRPMLAGSAPDVLAGVEKVGHPFVADTKLDGMRVQVHRVGDEVTIFTRSLDDVTERLPLVAAAARALPVERVVLDGEALLVDGSGRPLPFQDSASASDRVEPFFFDLLLLDDEPLLGRPLAERLERLDALVPAAQRVRRAAPADAADAERFFADVVADGHEGVVLKRLDAPYEAGRRGSAWVKVKPRHTLDLVVLAVEWGSGRRRGLLSNIHLGARSADGELVMVGKTFKGMTDDMLAWQTQRFLELETSRQAHVVHVRPEQVVEIALDGVQRSSRYPGGVALRFARVVRYRDDKSAAEADTIDSVRSLLA